MDYKRILRKVLHWKGLDYGEKKANIRSGANKDAFNFMRMHLCQFVKVSDVQEYCNQQSIKNRGVPLGDPPRAFEILRKDKLPLEWEEKKIGRNKYVIYAPQKRLKYTDDIVKAHSKRNDAFDKKTIANKLEFYGNKCAITGLPVSEGGLAADHWIPKEKGGLSDSRNCVILNKLLNEKKNNMMPVEWFTTCIMKNFIDTCIMAGLDKDTVKSEIIQYLQSQ